MVGPTSQALLQWVGYATITFVVAFACTPLLTSILYRYKLGKRIRNTGITPVFSRLHQSKEGTPTMGGIIVWSSVLLVVVLGLLTAYPILSRSQTYLPLGFLLMAALVGLADDLMNIFGIGPNSGGMRMRQRIFLYTAIAAVGALWFTFKLEWSLLYVPWYGFVDIGWWFVPLFIVVIVATGFSVNEIDGLDGLAGGTLLVSYAAISVVAFLEGKYDLAAFIASIIGALLAFLWFNIHPARFFMGDTGAMSLGVTLGVVAILTHTELYLPIIGLLFVLESLSVMVQIFFRKVFKRKLFRSSPLHHHFEAIGWSEPKIVMRFWVIAAVTASVGLLLVFADPMFPLLLR